MQAREAIEGALRNLRDELAQAREPMRRGRLFAEIGELEERVGDETAAARDLLAAFRADSSCREPLEGLLRLSLRHRSPANLARIVDELIASAETPDERARALLLRSELRAESPERLADAERDARESAGVGAGPNETALAWLFGERLAAKLGDHDRRLAALDARAKGAEEPTWKGLLLLDGASLALDSGDIDGALDRLLQVFRSGSGATFPALEAIERLARIHPGEPGTDEERRRNDALVAAVEERAVIAREAVADATRGDALGVPARARSHAHAADAALRAAEWRRSSGDERVAASLLDRARDFAASAPQHERDAIVPVLDDARMRIAELAGDESLVAELSARRLDAESHRGLAAALAVRVAEQALAANDEARAVAALERALERDPRSLPARALLFALLEEGDTPALAAQIEAYADELGDGDENASGGGSGSARGQAYLLAAWVWGALAGDVSGAKAALSQATLAGVSHVVAAQCGRTLAALRDDAAWYEDATRRLITSSAVTSTDAVDLVPPWFELVRARSLRGDTDGALKLLRELGATPGGAWIARALEAFLPDSRGTERSAQALRELAAFEQDADVRRALAMVDALTTLAAGDGDGARERLSAVVADTPTALFPALLLSEAVRATGDRAELARLLVALASRTPDRPLVAALRIEAALHLWGCGERQRAVDELQKAALDAPEATRSALAWAARGDSGESIEGKRRSIDLAAQAGHDRAVLDLERLGVELLHGNTGGALEALAQLGGEATGNIANAAALLRLTWPLASADGEQVADAIARIGALGTAAAEVAAAEQARVARSCGSADTADAARRWFDAGGGLAACLAWLAAADDRRLNTDARRAIASELAGEPRSQMLASAQCLEAQGEPSLPLLTGDAPAVRLANLELSPPGCDPRRRAAALTELGFAAGETARVDGLLLAGWSMLALGEYGTAKRTFAEVTAACPTVVAAWDGLRTAAEGAGDKAMQAEAAAVLGAKVNDSARGAAFSEEAGLLWLELGDEARAEGAFDASFARDASRSVAFDKLFRRVRDRKDGERMLTLIGRRLDATDDPPELVKLFWEQARMLRERGDQEGALAALQNVTMFEPDHVGALALSGEIHIRTGKFDEAASHLARLALLDDAPAANRVTAGIAAVDLYENKLHSNEKALEVLVALHDAKLTTLPVRERLARAAARAGAWQEATSILEELMNERPTHDGRAEAARLAMAIHRDRIGNPHGARAAVHKLLEEQPTDGEALDLLLDIESDAAARQRYFGAARGMLVNALANRPTDPTSLRKLVKVTRALSDDALQQIALAALVATGEADVQAKQALAHIAERKPRTPPVRLPAEHFRSLLAPGDEGPLADLFALLAPTLSEALGPTVASCGVGKRERIDPRSGNALRNEIVAWAGVLGISELEVYVGGSEAKRMQGVAGEVPAIVVGPAVTAPLSAANRARVGGELFALARGTTLLGLRDETTINAVVLAACNLADVRVQAPSYAMLAEIERQLARVIARKTRKLLPEICRAAANAGIDAKTYRRRALESRARMGVIASGEIVQALAELLGDARALTTATRGDARTVDLLRFALSPEYLELRRALGLEGVA